MDTRHEFGREYKKTVEAKSESLNRRSSNPGKSLPNKNKLNLVNSLFKEKELALYALPFKAFEV